MQLEMGSPRDGRRTLNCYSGRRKLEQLADLMRLHVN
jgi:hypothetical protein